MRRIVIGYGAFDGYQICEIPQPELAALAVRFPLNAKTSSGLGWEHLLITVAVHEELQRRLAGGAVIKKLPALKDLATAIITRGFREMSKVHHPDRSGDNDAQVRLTAARDRLLAMVKMIDNEEEVEGTVFVRAPQAPAKGRRNRKPFPPDDFTEGFSDDDVPF